MGGEWCRPGSARSSRVFCFGHSLYRRERRHIIGARVRQVIHRFRATRCCERSPLPHSVGVIETHEDVPSERQLTPAELVQLQRIIEAGLLARDARLSGAGFADATEQELSLLEDQGALARQRFIQANLGLVGMVSRQFAARCQLPDAELFQEGCLGLPACQLPTGSSPCTSLSANSSIMLRSYSSMVSILSPSMPAVAGHLG
jgi:hypothetical protein